MSDAMKRCDYCDEVKPDVTRRVDPFDLEINDRETVVPLCDDCYQLRFDEI
ncbi:hypothetical protein ABZW03_26225 [Kitasatospora sp. NPDC004799]|uniref:hypothetical protein n=1 Tax=Kitasatospora sp. NPDC004799 TaxID=3154460 RepID=UPI0033BD472E